MDGVLLVLIDSISEDFFNRYSCILTDIHDYLKKKMSDVDILVVGPPWSIVAKHHVDDARSLYQLVLKESQGRDVIVCDAFAGLLSRTDIEKILSYTYTNHYDICIPENTPEGLIPSVISCDFLEDLVALIPEGTRISSSLKNLVNWEREGVDIGLYLSHCPLFLNRVDFLPISKGAIDLVMKLLPDSETSITTLAKKIKKYPNLLRQYPEYVAIDITSLRDKSFCGTQEQENMSVELFQKIMDDLDKFAPEAMVSLGIWGEPFAHSQFSQIFHILKMSSRKVLVESRALYLSKEYCDLVLSRPNTELIFDISYTTEADFCRYKTESHSIEFTKSFIYNLVQKEHVWIQFTLTKENQSYIKSFLTQWGDFSPRVMITKADGIVQNDIQGMQLAPEKRHSCYALQREIIIKQDGSVMFCRQAQDPKNDLGSLTEDTIKTLWIKNQAIFENQAQGDFNSCAVCSQCDHWWIWN